MKNLVDQTIMEEIRSRLIAKGQTIAVSESVTAGLLQAALASAKDASDFFHGGITAYNIGQKARHLGINAIHAAHCDCVSKKIAEKMAQEICSLFASEWGIGITGYATAEKVSGNKIFCYYAICFENKMRVSKKFSPHSKEPFDIQIEYVNAILKSLALCLKKAGR